MPGISPKLPLVKDPVDGFLLTKSYREAIKQNFKMLMLTSPGERMMEPDFGVGLRRFLFEPFDSFVFDDIEEKIYEQVQEYMPFIEIVNIVFNDPQTEEYENLLGIQIDYFITPIGEMATLDFFPS